MVDGAGWVVLHDRYKSVSSPANLDHVVVGPPGVCVIDSKNWTGGRLRYDDRGLALGRYLRDDELHSAKVDADIVRRAVAAAVPGVAVLGVLVFVEDVALTVPVHHQQVQLVQAEQLLGWLTSQPARLSPTEVHQVASTLDAALPPRDGPDPLSSCLMPATVGLAVRTRPLRDNARRGRPVGPLSVMGRRAHRSEPPGRSWRTGCAGSSPSSPLPH